MITTLAPATLADTFWPAGGERTRWRALALAVAGSALLVLSARLRIPFWPVPMTMQTFAVLVIGMAYGARLGALTVALYLAEGALGLPVFAATPERGIGLGYMLGPTGGYLAGFLAAAWVSGWLGEHGWDRTVVRTLAAMLAGTALIYACGLAWLATFVGPARALDLGLLPFLPAAAAKIALAAVLLPGIWRVLGRGRQRTAR